MTKQQATIYIGRSMKLCHINVEGSSSEKSEYLGRFGIENNINVITVQETHIDDPSEFNTRRNVPGYITALYLTSKVYGIATYVKADSKEYSV